MRFFKLYLDYLQNFLSINSSSYNLMQEYRYSDKGRCKPPTSVRTSSKAFPGAVNRSELPRGRTRTQTSIRGFAGFPGAVNNSELPRGRTPTRLPQRQSVLALCEYQKKLYSTYTHACRGGNQFRHLSNKNCKKIFYHKAAAS